MDGKRIDTFPPTAQLKRCKPILEVLPGWKCDIGGIKNYEELPADAKNYVEFAEKHLGVPITIAVSYTHLDVYKRQGEAWCWKSFSGH